MNMVWVIDGTQGIANIVRCGVVDFEENVPISQSCALRYLSGVL